MCSFRSQRTTRSAVSVEGRGRRRGSGRRPDVAVGIPAHSGRSRDYRPPRHPPRQSSGGTQIPSILASAQYPSITSIWVPGPCGSVTAFARGMWHVRGGCAHYAVREGERACLSCALSMARSIQKSLPKRVGRCFLEQDTNIQRTAAVHTPLLCSFRRHRLRGLIRVGGRLMH